MDIEQLPNPQILQLSSVQIIKPKSTDNHVRSLVCEAKKEYTIVPHLAMLDCYQFC